MTGYLRLEERELTGEEIGDVNKRARERDRNRAQERWGDRGRRQAASRFFSELESKRVTMIKKRENETCDDAYSMGNWITGIKCKCTRLLTHLTGGGGGGGGDKFPKTLLSVSSRNGSVT